jgi:hypothetical protein
MPAANATAHSPSTTAPPVVQIGQCRVRDAWAGRAAQTG